MNTSQESYSSTASSSSSTVTFSNLSLALTEESDLDEAALAENLPPELLHPRHASSHSSSSNTSSRMPLSALSNSSSNRMTSKPSSSHHSKQSPKQLLRDLPKLKMTGNSRTCPPPAKRLKMRTSWSQ